MLQSRNLKIVFSSSGKDSLRECNSGITSESSSYTYSDYEGTIYSTIDYTNIIRTGDKHKWCSLTGEGWKG